MVRLVAKTLLQSGTLLPGQDETCARRSVMDRTAVVARACENRCSRNCVDPEQRGGDGEGGAHSAYAPPQTIPPPLVLLYKHH